jgi:hypothetical protein
LLRCRDVPTCVVVIRVQPQSEFLQALESAAFFAFTKRSLRS